MFEKPCDISQKLSGGEKLLASNSLVCIHTHTHIRKAHVVAQCQVRCEVSVVRTQTQAQTHNKIVLLHKATFKLAHGVKREEAGV